MTKIGFIGCGKMAQAIIKGMLSKGYSGSFISITDRTPELTTSLSQQLHVNGKDPQSIIATSDVIILSTKPQQSEEIFNFFSSSLPPKIVLSIMAGISSQTISNAIGSQHTIIRTMPNTPAIVSEGITGIALPLNMSNVIKDITESIFNPLGDVVYVDESQLHTLTALSGSGPAFIMKIADDLIQEGVRNGLDHALSKQLVLQTIIGAGRLAKQSTDSLHTLIDNVTSPGGTTQSGLQAYTNSQTQECLTSIISATIQRSRDLESGSEL